MNKPNFELILELLKEANPQAVLFDGFEAAIIAKGTHWIPTKDAGAESCVVAIYTVKRGNPAPRGRG